MSKLLSHYRSNVIRLLKMGVTDNKKTSPNLRTRVTKCIIQLLNDNKNDDQLKEDLGELMDVTDHKTRRP
eukprot:UN08940